MGRQHSSLLRRRDISFLAGTTGATALASLRMHKFKPGSGFLDAALARRFARKHLGFRDLITEAAVAVYMLVIINGYVALSQLSTQYYYIVAIDIGASLGWGLIDGFTNLMGESIDRGNQADLVKKIQSEKAPDRSVHTILEELEDTFIARFTSQGKRNIATNVLENSPGASSEKKGFATREDLAGLASILAIYLTAGLALSVPYVVLPDKLGAWLVSYVLGIAWLFYYGYTVGRLAGQKRVLVGLLTAGAGIAFLIISYAVYG